MPSTTFLKDSYKFPYTLSMHDATAQSSHSYVFVLGSQTFNQSLIVPPPMEASDEEISEYFQKLDEDSDITDHESDVE